MGPVQLQMSHAQDVGEACLDLRRRAWESPVLLVPLSHVRGGVLDANSALGQAVATVALAFVLDTDPESILAEAEAQTQSISEALANRAGGLMRQVYDIPTPLGWFNMKELASEDGTAQDPEMQGLRTLTPGEAQDASRRAKERSTEVPQLDRPLLSPDLSPEGVGSDAGISSWARRPGALFPRGFPWPLGPTLKGLQEISWAHVIRGHSVCWARRLDIPEGPAWSLPLAPSSGWRRIQNKLLSCALERCNFAFHAITNAVTRVCLLSTTQVMFQNGLKLGSSQLLQGNVWELGQFMDTEQKQIRGCAGMSKGTRLQHTLFLATCVPSTFRKCPRSWG
ncbi:unnamed protein product [Effrenium voratum]|nr:unnamed protein product [Effrenium voratum]